MELYCVICGEPWDNDCLHEVAEDRGHKCGAACEDGCVEYAKIAREFRVKGCEALAPTFGNSCQPREGEEAATQRAVAEAAYELLGDDMDGAAAMMEDSGLF